MHRAMDNAEEKSSDDDIPNIHRGTRRRTINDDDGSSFESANDWSLDSRVIPQLQRTAPPEDDNSSVPSLIDQYKSSSSDEDDSDESMPTADSLDDSMPALKHGTDSSSDDDSDFEAKEKNKSTKASLPPPVVKHRSLHENEETCYEIKQSKPKEPRLYVVKCSWCDGNMTQQWRDTFKKVVRDEVYGSTTLCPGCLQSYEISQEFHAECKYCKLPPPHLGQAVGAPNTYICQDCSVMRGLPYTKHRGFKTRSLHKGHAFGTPVHLVRMNVKGGGFEEGTDGNRGVVVGWMHPFHLVWVEGSSATDNSCVPIQCLRVIQHNPITSDEEAVLLPTGEFSSERNNHKLTARPEFTNVVKFMQMDTTSIYPKSIVVDEPEIIEKSKEKLPIADLYKEMRKFFDTANSHNHVTIVRVLDTWIKLLDLVVGLDILLKMKPKKGGGRTFDSVVFMIMSSKITLDFLVDFLVRTPYIGPPGSAMNDFEQGHDFSSHISLTPDQTHRCYVATMLLGPLRFLFVVAQLEQYSVFWKCLGCHPRAPLLIERLVRIVSRESVGEPDGVLLGKYARPALHSLMDKLLEYPLPTPIAETTLAIPPFRQYKTPYDEYFGEIPSWDSDDSDGLD